MSTGLGIGLGITYYGHRPSDAELQAEVSNLELRTDGSAELREDGSREERE